MRKLFLLAFLAIPDGLGGFEIPEPIPWDSYEKVAYGWQKTPFNKPKSSTYWEMSQWTIKWYKKNWAFRDAARLTVPEYYVTPFITRELKADE